MSKIRIVFLQLVLFSGCGKRPDAIPTPHRVYVWQRVWTPAVATAVADSAPLVQQQVIFGGEVVWENRVPRLVKCAVKWDALKAAVRPVALAMRIAPFGGPFDDATVTEQLVQAGRSLLKTATDAGVTVDEFQIDFDCAQKKLVGYKLWLNALRPVADGRRFTITTLPVWQEEPEFALLLQAVDSYILQVHSVQPAKPGDPVKICDPIRARRCVALAEKLGVPFEVSLPTYSALAGIDASGKVLGYSFEGELPRWSAGTRLIAFDSDPAEIADLVAAWERDRPEHMKGLIWYRLPISTDERNWRMSTWRAVMAGRVPQGNVVVDAPDGELVDVALRNNGDGAAAIPSVIKLRWEQSALVEADALPGWKLTRGAGEVTLLRTDGDSLSLSPVARRAIGWLRFNQRTSVHVELTPLPVGRQQ